MWRLIVSIRDHCCLSYFNVLKCVCWRMRMGLVACRNEQRDNSKGFFAIRYGLGTMLLSQMY